MRDASVSPAMVRSIRQASLFGLRRVGQQSTIVTVIQRLILSAEFLDPHLRRRMSSTNAVS